MERRTVHHGSRARRVLARAILPAIALALAGTGGFAAADATEKEKKPKVVLSPEMESKLAEIMKKAAAAKRKFWLTRMKKEIEQVTKAAGLDAESAKALEPVSEQAIDAALDGWTASFSDGWRTFFSQQVEGAPAIEQIEMQLDQSVQVDWFGDYVRPFEHPVWMEGVRRTLTAEQFAKWDKVQKERNEAVRKESAAALKGMVDEACAQQRRVFLAKGAAIRAALNLPKERAAKLDKLAETASITAADAVQKRAERMILFMDDEQRTQMLKTRQFYIGADEKDVEKQEAAWKEGVAAILLPEEIKQMETARESYHARRGVVMGQILLAQLDDKVAFTASQRQRLQPIAERLVKEQKSLFPEGDAENYYRIDPQLLFGAGAKASAAEMTAILDANQWKHWLDACLPKNTSTNRIVITPGKVQRATAKKTPPARVAEPEDLENGFSDFLHEKSAAERTRLLAVNLLKAEDAARVAGLSPEVTARLETAARGATEETLVAWKTNMENSVRSQVRDATPDNVRQRLAGMESYSYSTRTVGPEPAVWDKTVKAELKPESREVWKKELDARTAFHDRAIAALILSEFDRKIPLAAAQFKELEPKIADAVRDYAPDIGMMFSSNYPYSWYLQSYSMFIPFSAVPEKDLKAILSKEQWERWSTSEEMGNTSNYWENVQRYHTQRVKEKK